jgi:hypothetical protein
MLIQEVAPANTGPQEQNGVPYRVEFTVRSGRDYWRKSVEVSYMVDGLADHRTRSVIHAKCF